MPDKDKRTNSCFTTGGPAQSENASANISNFSDKLAAAQKLASAMPHNINKAQEHGEASTSPPKGQTVEVHDSLSTGSTLSETNASEKTGIGELRSGFNPANGPLDQVRVDSGGRALTTNQGVAVADNQNSLKAGLRGPTLLEDFILREKITHFDHERIPERVVHARGSAAHGYFECYESLASYTRASLFAEAGKRTPVFVRFSTVLGERGSADTARDVRGFAVKFYTDEGNWDLVGNNIPIFFIQDAMKFPDLVHAAKPEPHFAIPQASTAHDTFWDFVSLTPESTHMLMWVYSDRAIPRSFRMMQGFGVHTFRLISAEGQSHFVKFHWQPLAGTHSLAWDEAVKIAGADPDFHRRDLWEAIESGAYPEYELGMQIFTEAQGEEFSFDILDATKIVPEELVPVTPVGKMVLNRNPDNFFAETEQVAFCAAHIVPGLDFSNDPLLAGRIHSYVDTQITRLGGPNFHEIPINSPVAQAHNNQRDGMHRQAINRGRVAYEPNSLAGGCPFQAGTAGFMSFPQSVSEDKIRGKPERFADHYTQAILFWNSQTPVEKLHIINAFRFELTRVQTPAIRERVISMLRNVAEDLAEAVASGLGMKALPSAQPKALEETVAPEVTLSPSLSLFSRPGNGNIATRRVAIIVADGVDGQSAQMLQSGLLAEGVVARFVGIRLGSVQGTDGDKIEIDATFEAMPAVLFDALAVPGWRGDTYNLLNVELVDEFIKQQYRHCKPILALGVGKTLIESAGVKLKLPSGELDPGVLAFSDSENNDDILSQFKEAIAVHRHFERETH
ncbi:catalase [Nitrosomonas sp. Nm166]|uniref:catalase n=1 Tax=Nitrosomonas sp. Nm166 TaxID=1881054 RepID=UPI0008F37AF0|nr:catalase [Nitrosomonas sp. Nm166]SFE98124.1 catalase [Nitrosomonas sp. Nm166]